MSLTYFVDKNTKQAAMLNSNVVFKKKKLTSFQL